MSSSRGSPIPLFKIKVEDKGRIKDIREIIVRIDGLPGCLNGELVDFGDGVKGIVMGFTEREVLVLVLGDTGRLRMGRDVKGISKPFEIPVGDGFLGRMVTALGDPCDQGDPVEPEAHIPVFKPSLPITARAPLEDFLPTGTKVVDALTPIAKGQRELILGDRITGKTIVAVDAILNQKDTGVVCIYCCIGKSVSGVSKVMATLHNGGALPYTVILSATDNSPVGEQYLVPFAAASMGEHFASKGRDVLIVFDDLTKHAWAYRQLSLLLDRPPGREAYPGDIFYVQTQLMERAGRFNDDHGGGSMTFLAIAETLQGDLTGYIPSNLASMCDGQILLSSSVFAEGIRPAVDIPLSISIVGGRAQPAVLKKHAMQLRADYARYIEVLKLSRLSSGVGPEAARTIAQGESILAIFQQGQNCPTSLAEQVVLLYALEKGLVGGMSAEARDTFRKEIFAYVEERNGAIVDEINENRRLSTEVERALDDVLRQYTEEKSSTIPEGD